MIRILLNDNEFIEEFVSWGEIKNILSRSEMHGVIITQSLDIKLIQSAYTYIDNLDNTSDIASECTCIIQSHTSINGWKDEFNGYLDFTTLKRDNKDATKSITISAYSDNFANKFLERLDIEVPYDRLIGLDDNVITPFTNEYQTVDIIGIEALSINEITILPYDSSGVNIIFPSIIGTSQLDGWQNPSTQLAGGIGAGDTAPNDEWVTDRAFWINTKTKGRMTGHFNVTYTFSPSGSTRLLKVLDYKTLTPIVVATESTGGGDPAEPDTISIDFDYEFDETSRLVLKLSTSDLIGDILESEKGNFNLITKALPTPCKFIPPHEYAHRILEHITGQSTPLYSPFFGRTDIGYDEDGKGSLLFGTNGKLVRQFPIGFTSPDGEKVAQMATSFKKWFENYDKIYCIGAGVIFEYGQYKLYVDDRKNFYQNTVVFEVTEMEAKSFSKDKNLDLYYSEIEIGSEYEEPEEVSGLEEYLSKQKYSTPILNENKLELATEFITAAYPFEFARRKQYEGTETEDYKYDTNTMLFKVYRDGVFVQHSDQDFDVINGLENISNYINLDITPQRILRENFGWWLNSGLRGYQDKYLKYNKSDIVTDLGTLKITDTEEVIENSNIQISTLDTAKFTGNVVRFLAPISSNSFDAIRNNPYGLIKYFDPLKSDYGYGFVKEVSTSPIDRATNWELWETTGFEEGLAIRLLEDGAFRLLEDGAYRLLE